MQKPLVSILIPTYNRPVYFKQALISAIVQSYSNIEIIICDDSTNDESQKIVLKYINKFPHKIKYYKNKTTIGGRLNFQLALQKANGQYINFLMDDDLFHPQKIERMMQYFLQNNNNIKLITSYRQPIDDTGNKLSDFSFTKKKFHTDTIIDGITASNSMILDGNWIGEPTTPLFRKKDLIEPFGHFNGTQYYSAVDMASWLSLLSNGNLLYMSDTLSYLRMHPSNAGKNKDLKIKSTYDWIHMLFHCPRYKILEHSNHLSKSIQECLHFIEDLYILYPDQMTQKNKQLLQFYKYCLRKYQKECRNL
ncbi:glycosyltransferase family 2 protein [Bacillus cereus]|uniref:glycosyltransferase family 2 protein n=1 Tax=Bacillus cereus TaxID=1396 RepID=UPI002111A1FA|nr:glycosyltransferase family 2 protein [Bacillus cereus]HDR4949054.1 glycosyltransferase family 2 protein [Bacillus cereus]